ncbi:uncharacterized protein LOC130683210 [Manis pentadactyla]|uniref:uncharacterized protein LOC130683210 n=1 Tax=Manis pentadactyla TaxID=143292 RepID=UPI00255D142A|nr:uncharacterized protein LOC130683210 [Manis pentadactyla]
MTSLCLLILLLSLETPTQGVLRWGILSAFPKPIPVRHNAAVFPRFFTTNSSINLPYLALDTVTVPLGENRTFVTKGTLCFTTNTNCTNCISLKQRVYGWYDPKISPYSTFEVIWLNGTFARPHPLNTTHCYGTSSSNRPKPLHCRRPYQPRYAPQCRGDYEGDTWPWTDCQSHIATWVDEDQHFSLSPDMSRETLWKTQEESDISQDVSLNPFHKWMLCGTNGSCSDISSLSLILGGNRSSGYVSLQFKILNQTRTSSTPGCRCTSCTGAQNLSASLVQCFDSSLPYRMYCLYQIINNTAPKTVPPTPVCLYPPFLFILSNYSFDLCSNSTCFLSQCWDARKYTSALVARIPRWVPVPVDAPNSMTLFREKRDFGITAAIVTIMSVAAVAATAAAIALDTSIKTATELNNLAESVSSALDRQSTLDGKLKGGIMVLNQQVDLVEEQIDVLWQLAQLGCEQKFRALCITSVQYENFTRAANLSRDLSRYLSGNWFQDFDGTLEELRREIIHINSTRIDISVATGLSSWFHRALSHVKEWAGMAGMGVVMLGGLMLLLWLLCRLRTQQRRDKVVIAQALLAVEMGASPQVWLNILKKEAQL